MARYLDEAAAAADGIRIADEPEQQRFALYRDDAEGSTLIGEAHYLIRGENVVDFDHTIVDEQYRGTGLSGLLAQHALTSEVAKSHDITASCWFIEGYLKKHPELA